MDGGFQGFCPIGNTIQILVQSRTPSTQAPVNADALPTWRVYGQTGVILNGTASKLQSGSITGATDATPIVVTSAAHGLATGSVVTISGVLGNTAANGTFVVTVVDANTFSLNGTTGNGSYTAATGTWNATGLYAVSIPATSINNFASGNTYSVVTNWGVSSVQQESIATFTVV